MKTLDKLKRINDWLQGKIDDESLTDHATLLAIEIVSRLDAIIEAEDMPDEAGKLDLKEMKQKANTAIQNITKESFEEWNAADEVGKIEVGSRVMVIDRKYRHGFKIGEIVTINIINRNEDGIITDYRCGNKTHSWYLKQDEFELIKP